MHAFEQRRLAAVVLANKEVYSRQPMKVVRPESPVVSDLDSAEHRADASLPFLHARRATQATVCIIV
jgi:hypothetical protein